MTEKVCILLVGDGCSPCSRRGAAPVPDPAVGRYVGRAGQGRDEGSRGEGRGEGRAGQGSRIGRDEGRAGEGGSIVFIVAAFQPYKKNG